MACRVFFTFCLNFITPSLGQGTIYLGTGGHYNILKERNYLISFQLPPSFSIFMLRHIHKQASNGGQIYINKTNIILYYYIILFFYLCFRMEGKPGNSFSYRAARFVILKRIHAALGKSILPRVYLSSYSMHGFRKNKEIN